MSREADKISREKGIVHVDVSANTELPPGIARLPNGALRSTPSFPHTPDGQA